MEQEFKDLRTWLNEQTGEVDLMDYLYEGYQGREAAEMAYQVKINIGTKESPQYVTLVEFEKYLDQ